MNRRRQVLMALGFGFLVLPVRSFAGTEKKVHRVACLWPGERPSLPNPRSQSEVLKRKLRESGYVVGQNIQFDENWVAGDLAILPSTVARIVAQKPDVIVASTTTMVRALHQATKKIPIVMTYVPDPVAAGFAASLARPGGNVTGLSDMSADFTGKKIELIRAVAPRTARIGILVSKIANASVNIANIEAGAKAFGWTVYTAEVSSPDKLEDAMLSLAKQKVTAVIVLGGPPLNYIRPQIAQQATQHRMFTVSQQRAYVDAGGLMSYGVNAPAQAAVAAAYVEKILKGARPEDLPIQQPTTLELVINRKTATALGITISPELLLRADEIIE